MPPETEPQPSESQLAKPESSKLDSPIKDKLAELIVPVLMAGGISTGSFGAFWVLFKKSDIPIMIVSGVIGIGATYLTVLLKPLHEGNQRRLGKTGEWLDRRVDGFFEWANWQFAGCDGKYLQRQGERCREYYGIDVEDFKQPEGILQVNLDEVFVPLNLDMSMGHGGGRLEQSAQEQPYEIWDFLKQVKRVPSYRCMSILADGGSGKTTLLRHVAHKYAQGRHRKAPKLLPFLLYLRKWRDVIAENPEMTLPELMGLHVRSLRGGKDLKLPSNWAKDRLVAGKALVMFDGYDEVSKSQRQSVAAWISREVELYPESVFLITSRYSGYDDFKAYAAEVPTTLQVRPFGKAERDRFVRKWYLSQERLFRLNRMTAAARDDAEQKARDLMGQIDASPELQKMSENPLQLNLIARVHKFANGAPLPHQKTKLYQEIFDLQLGARPLAKRVEMVLESAQERQLVLQSVALEMVRQEAVVQVEKEVLLGWMRSGLASVDETVDAGAFLKQVVQVAELIYEAEAEEFAFSHLSFRNYLAALECLRLRNWDEVVGMFGIDGCREMILMLSGRLKPAVLEQLVCKACAVNSENVYLAYDCLVRYPNQAKIEPSWLDALQTMRYGKLEQLMQAGEWRKADQLTYRLMIQTCRKDFGSDFSVKDLQEFPCPDLRRIDDLWVRHSQGRFGFSVQKKIWEDCGSPQRYSGEDKEKWHTFWEQVGWTTGGTNFVDYDNLTWNLNARFGQLPSRCFCLGPAYSLFSRAATCEL
jgi:GUN4-like/NACHT domain